MKKQFQEKINTQVTVIRIRNAMTPLQRCAFNSILTLGKDQLDKHTVTSFARVDLGLVDLGNIMQIEHMTQEHAFAKLQEFQRISVEVEIFGENGRRKEVRFFNLISEIRILTDNSNKNLISIYLPGTLRERLMNLEVNSVLSVTDVTIN